MHARKPRPDGRPDETSKRPRRLLFESFRCDKRSIDLKMHECMTDFVNANALRNKTSPCHNCTVGQENRTRFAKLG
ncbi:MAG: hypothetical protein KC502_07295 [Myxococcales bacterium]|nr:hypothetical protein [Myxococcales bacterium]